MSCNLTCNDNEFAEIMENEAVTADKGMDIMIELTQSEAK